MTEEAANHLIVGRDRDCVVATCQITFIQGPSSSAARRVQIEMVRVAPALRERGIGAAPISDAERRAVAAGCHLLQCTTDARRDRAQAF